MVCLFSQERPGRQGPQDYQGSTPSTPSTAWKRETQVHSLTSSDLEHTGQFTWGLIKQICTASHVTETTVCGYQGNCV